MLQVFVACHCTGIAYNHPLSACRERYTSAMISMLSYNSCTGRKYWMSTDPPPLLPLIALPSSLLTLLPLTMMEAYHCAVLYCLISRVELIWCHPLHGDAPALLTVSRGQTDPCRRIAPRTQYSLLFYSVCSIYFLLHCFVCCDGFVFGVFK